MVTDPPYGVNYDRAWRIRAGVNLNERKLGRVANELDLGTTKEMPRWRGSCSTRRRTATSRRRSSGSRPGRAGARPPVELQHSGPIDRKDLHEFSDAVLIAIIGSAVDVPATLKAHGAERTEPNGRGFLKLVTNGRYRPKE